LRRIPGVHGRGILQETGPAAKPELAKLVHISRPR
jgi:hypothetical protein